MPEIVQPMKGENGLVQVSEQWVTEQLQVHGTVFPGVALQKGDAFFNVPHTQTPVPGMLIYQEKSFTFPHVENFLNLQDIHASNSEVSPHPSKYLPHSYYKSHHYVLQTNLQYATLLPAEKAHYPGCGVGNEIKSTEF